MKKLLVIANLYHASPRIPNLLTYLSNYGWDISIVTVPLSKGAEEYLGFPMGFLEKAKIIEAPYRGDIFWIWRKLFKLVGYKTDESITEQIKENFGITSKRSLVDALIKWYQTIYAYPDTERLWKEPALKAASNILREEHFDAILSSSPFPTSHIVAAELKRKYGICWLADLRDLWTQNHAYPYGSMRRYFEKKLENKILSHVDRMATVSDGLAKKQMDFQKRPVHVITNGFNPDHLNNPVAPLTKKLTITYTGKIYTDKQDPEKYLVVLANLISKTIINPSDIEVRFYGPCPNWFQDIVVKYHLRSIVKQYGTIPRYESLKKQRESHLLLLFNWEDPREKGVYTGKIFEYLSAQRPILATGGFHGSDLEKLLIETKAGDYASNDDEIEASMMSFYEEYKRSGKVFYKGDFNEINKYSYNEIAKKFTMLLDEMIQ